MHHFATILDAIEKGIEGDKEGCRAYAALWLEKLQQDGEQLITPHLQRLLAGEKGQIIHLAEKPYHILCLVGTHVAYEEHFTVGEKEAALSFARAMQGQWTNQVPNKQFHKFTHIVVKEHGKLIFEISEGLHEVRKSQDES